MKKIKLESIENASVIRKFSVLFSLMSFFPFIILASLFFYLSLKGKISLNLTLIFWSAILVGIFALIGFFGMRRTLINLTKITQGTKSILQGKIPDKINVDISNNNEVAQIARAFNDVVQKLELNIQELEKSKSMLHDVLNKIATGASSANNINTF